MSDRPLPGVVHGDPDAVAPNSGQPIPGVVHGDPNATLDGGNQLTPDQRFTAGDRRRRAERYHAETTPAQVAADGVRVGLQQIPIVGRAVQSTEGSDRFRDANPMSTTALGIVAPVPPISRLSRLMSYATGPKFGRNLMGQSALGASINVGDAAAGDPNLDSGTAIQRGVIGAIAPIPASIAGRFIGPSGLPRPAPQTNAMPPPLPIPATGGPPPIPGAVPNPQPLRTPPLTGDRLAQTFRNNNAPPPNVPQLDALLAGRRARRDDGTELLRAFSATGQATRRAEETAARGAALSPGVERALASIAGGAAGHVLGGPVGALYGLGGGFAGREVIRGLTNSRRGQRYLGRNISEETMALLNALPIGAVPNLPYNEGQ